MKRLFLVLILMLMLLTLTMPLSAMENQMLSLIHDGNSMNLSVEQLEKQLNLKRGELQAVTFVRIPEYGQLISVGVPVANGETLLRWELEELYYLSNSSEKDWFAMIPHCDAKCSAIVNISK